MTYKKNVSNMVIAIVCVVLFVVTAFYCVPRFSLLSSNALPATVADADKHGTSGYAVLKVDEAREDGGTIFFRYYYPGSKSHLKQDEKVLVSGNITFMDESTEQGVNADLVIGTKAPVLICLILSLLGMVGAICLLPSAIHNFRNKPWSSDEEIDVKNKSVNAFYTAEILALVVALIFFAAGMPKVVGYACEKNHTTGNDDNSMSVLSQFELVMAIISGAFLLLHVVSAWLLSKKNPYGGKLFWFFKF